MEFAAAGSAKVPGLPAAAFTALVETTVAISRDPWGATEPDTPHPPEFRWAVFGEAGIVSIHVDDAGRVVRVHDVLWTG